MVGQIGQDRAAFHAAGGKRAQAARLDAGNGLHDGGEHHLVFAGDDGEHRRAAPLVWHMLDVHAGQELEQFAAEMLEAADARRA